MLSHTTGSNEVKQTMLQPLNPLPATYQSHHVHAQLPPITEGLPGMTSQNIVTVHESTTTLSYKPTVLHSHKTADATIHRALNSRICALPNVHEQKQKIGKSPLVPKQGLMWPTQQALDHDAAPLLDEYATSRCPIDCGHNWSLEQIQAALKYGSSASPLMPYHGSPNKSEKWLRKNCQMERYQKRYPTEFQALTCGGNDPTQKQSIPWDTRPLFPAQSCRY